jgi:hypothetical protein
MFMYHPDTQNIGDGKRYARGWLGKYASSAQEVADTVTKYASSPCLWANGERKKANFRCAEWIGLDFDEGMTLDEAIKTFEPYLHVIGTTKSHQVEKNGVTCDRFRVFLRLGTRCTKASDYEATANEMIETHKSDKACKDAGRFFWPCQEIIVCKYFGKIVKLVDSSREEEKKSKRIKARNKKLNDYYSPTKTIPGRTKLMLDCGVMDGTRTISCYQAARDLGRVGYSEYETLNIVWNSAIPLNSSEECYQKVIRTVRSAFSKSF